MRLFGGVCINEDTVLLQFQGASESEEYHPTARSALPSESPVSSAGWTGTWESTWGWACRWIIDASSCTNDSLTSSSLAAIGSSYIKAADAPSVFTPVCLSVYLSVCLQELTLQYISFGFGCCSKGLRSGWWWPEDDFIAVPDSLTSQW